MIYIFEDNAKKALSKLFKAAYPEEISRNFIFAGGNGEIEHKIRKNIDKTNFVVAFIDIVPDNENAITIFDELIDLENTEFNGKLFIMPIVCAEYYFIKSIYNRGLKIRNKESAKLCIERGFYKDDTEIKSEQDRLKCKNFEKYCKFVRNRSLLECMQDDKNPKETYLIQECKCIDYDNSNCSTKALVDKAIELLTEYEVIPPNSYAKNRIQIDIGKAHQIRSEFINRHNKIVENYRKIDKDNAENYIYIRSRW